MYKRQIFDFKKIIEATKSETLKETLLQKFSKELNMKKELLLSQDAPKKKIIKPLTNKKEKLDFDNQSSLIIYLYENFYEIIKDSTKSFESFLLANTNDVLNDLKETIISISNGDKAHKEYSIYAKAMMIDMNLSNEEVLHEFNRAADSIRLESDKSFLDYLKKLAEKRELTPERKENLQKLLNLSDNISVQEEELIKFLNTYS